MDVLHGPSKIRTPHACVVLSGKEAPVVHGPWVSEHNYFRHIRQQAMEEGIEDYGSAEYIAFLERSLAEARRVILNDFPEE